MHDFFIGHGRCRAMLVRFAGGMALAATAIPPISQRNRTKVPPERISKRRGRCLTAGFRDLHLQSLGHLDWIACASLMAFR